MKRNPSDKLEKVENSFVENRVKRSEKKSCDKHHSQYCNHRVCGLFLCWPCDSVKFVESVFEIFIHSNIENMPVYSRDFYEFVKSFTRKFRRFEIRLQYLSNGCQFYELKNHCCCLFPRNWVVRIYTV